MIIFYSAAVRAAIRRSTTALPAVEASAHGEERLHATTLLSPCLSLSLSIVRKRSTSRCTHSKLCTRCCCSGRWWWCWPRRRWPMRCCCWCCCCRQRRWFMTERKRNKSCLELRKYNNSDDDNKNNSKDNNNFEMDACCNVWRKMKLYRKR